MQVGVSFSSHQLAHNAVRMTRMQSSPMHACNATLAARGDKHSHWEVPPCRHIRKASSLAKQVFVKSTAVAALQVVAVAGGAAASASPVSPCALPPTPPPGFAASAGHSAVRMTCIHPFPMHFCSASLAANKHSHCELPPCKHTSKASSFAMHIFVKSTAVAALPIRFPTAVNTVLDPSGPTLTGRTVRCGVGQQGRTRSSTMHQTWAARKLLRHTRAAKQSRLI